MKAFGSPSMRSFTLECVPGEDLFSAEVKNRIFGADMQILNFLSSLEN